MFNLICRTYADGGLIRSLGEEFAQIGYVKLPGLFQPAALDFISRRVTRLREKATRRAFTMPGVGTPRRLATLGGTRIAAEDPLLASLYFHHEFVTLVQAIVGGSIYPCRHAQEFMVANFLTQRGDSHGWHLDDPAYAIVFVFEAPPPEQGGTLEFISHWRERCAAQDDDPETHILGAVNKARLDGAVSERHHRAGDAYVLNAAATLHRVTPVASPGVVRTVLNFAYQAVEFQVYGHTATALYGDPELAAPATVVDAAVAPEGVA